MLSNKEDFDRFMADDDISAYVAILKATIKDTNKSKLLKKQLIKLTRKVTYV